MINFCDESLFLKKAIPYGNYMLLLYPSNRYIFVSNEDFNAHWFSITTCCYSFVKALYSLDIKL